MLKNSPTENRILWIDIVRVLAAFMVVFIHSPKPIEGMNNNIIYALYNYIMLPCVPLFFIISGYLLLPTKDSLFLFLRKRFKRIVYPLLFWSIICILITPHNSLNDLIKEFFYIPFCQKANGHYWFLYSLISIYLVLPIISLWLKQASQREIQFLLYTWLLVSTLPFLNILLPNVFNGNGDYYNLLYYNAGFIGYFVLGFYLKNFSHKRESMNSFLLMILTSSVHLSLVYLNKLGYINIPEMNPYLCIDVILQSLFIFLLIREYGMKLYRMRKIFYFLSPLTFGIYLVHGLIHKYITFPFIYDTLKLPSALAVPISAIITFAIGTLCIYLISKLPKSRFLIG